MHNNEKIGVGILTCNRKQNCKVLFDCLASCIKYKIIDELILVKNREFEYDNFDFEHIETNNIKYLNVKEDVGVGYCKNAAFLHLLNKNCDHIFLIEDDTIIKDPIVFAKYIDTAKHFKMEHLVFGYGSGGSELDEFNENACAPICTIQYKDQQLDFYHHIQGAFTYYTRKCLQYIGLMDANNYVNVVEHIEHTYRIIKAGYYSMFWAFADIHNSKEYLDHDHCGTEYKTTIPRNNALYNRRVEHAYAHFYDVYHINFYQIKFPSKNDIYKFMKERLH